MNNAQLEPSRMDINALNAIQHAKLAQILLLVHHVLKDNYSNNLLAFKHARMDTTTTVMSANNVQAHALNVHQLMNANHAMKETYLNQDKLFANQDVMMVTI